MKPMMSSLCTKTRRTRRRCPSLSIYVTKKSDMIEYLTKGITQYFHQNHMTLLLQSTVTWAYVSVWVAFDMGKHFQYISIGTFWEALGPRKAKALPLFHAITSSWDNTSSFQGKGKKSEWDAWHAYEEATSDVFLSVLDGKFTQLDANSAAFSVIERFVVVLYDKNSSASKVNATRRVYGFFYEKVSTKLFPV